MWHLILALASSLLVSGCAVDNMETFYKNIKKYGYIPYYTPLQHSGTGTLVGGNAQDMSLVAPPQTCFPDDIDQIPTRLRVLDHSSLPYREFEIEIDAKLALEVMQFMPTDTPGGGVLGGLSIAEVQRLTPNLPLPIMKKSSDAAKNQDAEFMSATSAFPITIAARAGYSQIKKVVLEMKGVHVEYLDSVKLVDYYKNRLSETCKDFLQEVGFVIQAVKADELRFSFEDKKGGFVDLSVGIDGLLKIHPEIRWRIEQKTYLIFESPRYIGYQLGRLRHEDQGMAFYRATTVDKKYKYQFKKIGVFNVSQGDAL